MRERRERERECAPLAAQQREQQTKKQELKSRSLEVLVQKEGFGRSA